MLFLFQTTILETIKEHDSELLTAILTDESIKKDLNLNHIYPDGKTLLHSAIEAENEEAVRYGFTKNVINNNFWSLSF